MHEFQRRAAELRSAPSAAFEIDLIWTVRLPICALNYERSRHLKASVQGVDIFFLVDTGSTTILSDVTVFKRLSDCELKPCSLPLTVIGVQPLPYVGTLDVVDKLRPYNGQDSSHETATADDELPEEHVTREDAPEESTLPTPDVSWEELPDTDALENDADIPKRCRRRPRYLDDYV